MHVCYPSAVSGVRGARVNIGLHTHSLKLITRAPSAVSGVHGARVNIGLHTHSLKLITRAPSAVSGVRGARVNMRIAQAWTQAFASPGSVLEKNFSLMGAGGTDGKKARELLMKVCVCVSAPVLLHVAMQLVRNLWTTHVHFYTSHNTPKKLALLHQSQHSKSASSVLC